jgi:hypothetical protein
MEGGMYSGRTVLLTYATALPTSNMKMEAVYSSKTLTFRY